MPTLMGLQSLRDTHACPHTRIYQTRWTLCLSFAHMRRAFPPGNSSDAVLLLALICSSITTAYTLEPTINVSRIQFVTLERLDFYHQ